METHTHQYSAPVSMPSYPLAGGLVPQCLNTWVFFTTFGALNKGVALQLLSDHGATEQPFSAAFNQAEFMGSHVSLMLHTHTCIIYVSFSSIYFHLDVAGQA